MINRDPGPIPQSCPRCGGEDIRQIVYGLIGPEFFENPESAKYHAAGCVVRDEDWYCAGCGGSWQTGGVVRDEARGAT